MEDSSQDRPCEPPGRALVAPELGVPDSRDGAVNGTFEVHKFGAPVSVGAVAESFVPNAPPAGSVKVFVLGLYVVLTTTAP